MVSVPVFRIDGKTNGEYRSSWNYSLISFGSFTHFFYRQLDFQSEPGSCSAIFENGLETEPTLPAEHSFRTKISKRNQLF